MEFFVTLVFRMRSKRRKCVLFAALAFLQVVGAKWGRKQRERTLESKLKRLSGKNKLVKEKAAASNEPINFRNRACFTFPLDNNSDVLMLIEIIFD